MEQKKNSTIGYCACEYRCRVFSRTSARLFLDASEWNELTEGITSAPNPSLPALISTDIYNIIKALEW